MNERQVQRERDRAAARARGSVIAKDYKRLRVEEEFWCLAGCRRRVAAVVIHEGERCLFVVGGRDERVRRDLDDALYAAQIKAETVEVASEDFRRFHQKALRFWEAKAAELERDGGIVFEPFAAVIGPLLTDDGPVEEEGQAACGKCHRGYWLTITPRRQVLMRPRNDT